jgi:hypothetical protein
MTLRRRRLQAVHRALIQREHRLTQQQESLRRRESQLDALTEALADQRLLLDSLVHEARRACQAPNPSATPVSAQDEQLARQRRGLAEQEARQAQRERWLDARTEELVRALRRVRREPIGIREAARQAIA